MKYLLILLAAFSTSAFAVLDDNSTNQNQGQLQGQGQAQGQLQGQGQGQGQAQSLVNAPNTRISNDSRAAAMSFAGASSGSSSGASVGNTTSTSQGGSSVSGSSSGGNSLTVNEAPIPADTSVRYGGSYTVKNVPSVVTGNVYPTAPCMGSSAVGGSGVGFGFSIGSSWTDDECGIRETSRSFNALGLKEDAVRVLCTSKYAATAAACKEK